MASTRPRRWAPSLLWVVGAVCVFGGVVVGGIQAQSRGESRDAEQANPPVRAVPPDTSELLGVFRHQQGTADRIPNAESRSAEVSDRVAGESFELARRAELPGGSVYLWPTADGACFAAAGVSSCAPAEQIASLGVILATYRGEAIPPGYERVTGIARDGIGEVTVVLDGSGEISVPVMENSFLVDVKGDATEVRWHGPQGKASQRLPGLPPPPPEAGLR